MRTCFFIPYAGSLGYDSPNWGKQYRNDMNIVMIKYSGRGSRADEEFAETWEELIEDVYQQVVTQLDNSDYILFGHSMGAIVAYEIYYKLYENSIKLPSHIFLSGSNPPNMINKRLCTMNENEIIALGGIPEVILKSKKILNMVFLIICKDLDIFRSYNFHKHDKGLKCPVTIINGTEDSLVDCTDLWRFFAENTYKFICLPGGHFFIFEKTKEIMEMLNTT